MQKSDCLKLSLRPQIKKKYADIQLTNVSETGSSKVLGPSSSSGAPGTVISPSISTFTFVGTKPCSDAILIFYFTLGVCCLVVGFHCRRLKMKVGPRWVQNNSVAQSDHITFRAATYIPLNAISYATKHHKIAEVFHN